MTKRYVARAIVPVTLMWLIGLPFLYWLFVYVAKWPADLTVILFSPILLVWIPVSYPLAMIGYRKHLAGQALIFSTETLLQLLIVAMLLMSASAGGVLIYVFTRVLPALRIIVITVFELGCLVAVFVVFGRVLRGLDSSAANSSDVC